MEPTQPTGGLWKNRYRMEKELGRGGFGVVYLARDQQLLSKPVVIKVLQDQSEPDPYFQKKFQQEIEALARIDHPGVVGVLDVGETPEGRPFLVMQFVEGVTLRSEISGSGMDFRRVAHILRQVGQALGAAHDKGVYHRDLKPENIMLQRAGETEEYVKLIDFGIAAVRDSQVAAHSQTSKVVGTLSYMAPEQVMGKGGAASDIYSLAVIAFEMLTGQRPDVGPQGVAVKARELRAEMPEAAQEIILKALSYQPDARPAKPREFGDQLARALGAEPTITSPLPAVATSVTPSQSSSSANLERAYVLFMDIVAYSKLKMDLQSQRIQQLGQIVRSTAEFRRAQQSDQVISLPTGDGMALVFFQNPTSPIECATEISRALKTNPDIKLRMGIHTGLVYRIADINTNNNVAGGGINLAQRVMDCGDAGHILLSKTFADDLGELSDWEPMLHDLGEAEVKHGVKVNVVNFYSGEIGNSALPEKLRKSSAAPVSGMSVAAAQPHIPTAVQPPPPSADQAPRQPIVQFAPPAEASNRGNRTLVLVGVAVVLLVVAAAAMKLGPWGSGSAPSGETEPVQGSMTPASETQPAQSSMAPAGGVPPSSAPPAPPSAEPPAAVPAPASGSNLTQAAAPAMQPRPAASATTARTPAPAAAVSSSLATEAAAASPPSTPATQSGAAAERAQLQEARERMIPLAARAAAASRTMGNMVQGQASQGVGMRADMAAARDSMEYLMEDAQRALAERDLETAQRNMDLAERQIEKLENFLGR